VQPNVGKVPTVLTRHLRKHNGRENIKSLIFKKVSKPRKIILSEFTIIGSIFFYKISMYI